MFAHTFYIQNIYIFCVGRIITWIQHVNFLLRMLQYKSMKQERFESDEENVEKTYKMFFVCGLFSYFQR